MVNRSSFLAQRLSMGAMPWLAVLLGTLSCQAQAGMFCQQQSDCRVGLVCAKSPGVTSANAYGVCQPALHGAGEPCLSSGDCDSGLICSNEIGIFNGDERHGLCQSGGTATDGGTTDGSVADLSVATDLSHVD